MQRHLELAVRDAGIELEPVDARPHCRARRAGGTVGHALHRDLPAKAKQFGDEGSYLGGRDAQCRRWKAGPRGSPFIARAKRTEPLQRCRLEPPVPIMDGERFRVEDAGRVVLSHDIHVAIHEHQPEMTTVFPPKTRVWQDVDRGHGCLVPLDHVGPRRKLHHRKARQRVKRFEQAAQLARLDGQRGVLAKERDQGERALMLKPADESPREEHAIGVQQDGLGQRHLLALAFEKCRDRMHAALLPRDAQTQAPRGAVIPPQFLGGRLTEHAPHATATRLADGP